MQTRGQFPIRMSFTNRQKRGSNELSIISDARVYVYASGEKEPIKKYYVPKGKTGNKWDVFYFDKEGKIVSIDQISYSNSSDGSSMMPLK